MKRKGLTVKFFKWNKILVVLGIIIGIVIINSFAIRWPISTFPVIEGKVLDTTTGEPIENVVVSVNWIRSSPGPAGEITRTIRRDIVVTDKEGTYRIPRLWSFHLLSVFSRGYMGFMHPLYASKAAVVARERRKIIIGSPALKAYPEEFEYKHGILHYDIELLSLEEKYIKAAESLKLVVDSEERKKTLKSIAYELGLDFIKFAQSSIVNFKVNREYLYDVDYIFSRWEEITNRTGKTRDLERAKEWIARERKEYEK